MEEKNLKNTPNDESVAEDVLYDGTQENAQPITQQQQRTEAAKEETRDSTPEINIIGIKAKQPQKHMKMKVANKGDVKAVAAKQSFASGLNFYKLFWIFFIGSIVGVIIEMIFCLIVDRRLESRSGVIYGPFNPVYGFGAVLITLALYWLRNKRDFWIFLCGGVVGAAFEYICSWYQETFLGTVSWDYSNMVGNIGGRTSVLYALCWGLLSIVWLKFIFPFMSRMIEKIPNKFGKGLTWLLLIFMAFNCLISAAAVNRMSARYEGVEPRSAFDVFLDQVYPDEFLVQIYTHMQYSNGVGTDHKFKDDPQNPPPKPEPSGSQNSSSN